MVDLTGELGLAQSTVSKHLTCLRGCRLVDDRAEGRQSFYFIAAAKLLDQLRSAEQLLTAIDRPVPHLWPRRTARHPGVPQQRPPS